MLKGTVTMFISAEALPKMALKAMAKMLKMLGSRILHGTQLGHSKKMKAELMTRLSLLQNCNYLTLPVCLSSERGSLSRGELRGR